MKKTIIRNGVKMNKGTHKFWTKKEIDLLKKEYSQRNNIYALFPDRTKASIKGKASILNLRRPGKDTCRYCGIELNNRNTYEKNMKKYNYICKQCIVLNNKKNRQRRPEHFKKYAQETMLHTNGKTYCSIKKRPKPDACELCSKHKKLSYHHYGDIKPKSFVPGLWLCGLCHMFAEGYEDGILKRYLEIRLGAFNENLIN